MSDLIKVNAKIRNHSNVLQELEGNIKEYRSHMLKGFFYTSNSDAFLIAEDVVSGVLTELKPNWVATLNQAIEDLLTIAGTSRKTIKYLADLGVTLREILDDIENYDSYETPKES
jgi:hypothetical protein